MTWNPYAEGGEIETLSIPELQFVARELGAEDDDPDALHGLDRDGMIALCRRLNAKMEAASRNRVR
jgi:hypothetical protein